MRCTIPLIVLICLMSSIAVATEEDGPAKTPGVEELGNNLYKLGDILIDKNKSMIRFPAKVNMNEGLIELFLCAPYGKTHESLLVTEVNGINLNLALILIGCKAGELKVKEQGEDVIPDGSLVTIEIEFKDDDGKVKRVRAEDWIYNDKLKAAMPHAAWVYTGSYIHEGEYMAKLTGTYIVTFHDPYTIIDLPLKEAADDTVYWVNKEAAKKKEHPVDVIITLVKKGEHKKEDDAEESSAPGDQETDKGPERLAVGITRDGEYVFAGKGYEEKSLIKVIAPIVEEKGADNVFVTLFAEDDVQIESEYEVNAIGALEKAGCKRGNITVKAQRHGEDR